MTTSTSPISISYAEHRAEAPVWAFHLLVARILWLLAVIGYAAEVFMFAAAGRRSTIAGIAVVAVLFTAAITFGLLNA